MKTYPLKEVLAEYKADPVLRYHFFRAKMHLLRCGVIRRSTSYKRLRRRGMFYGKPRTQGWRHGREWAAAWRERRDL